MLASIQPIQASFQFGVADTLSLRSIADDLATTATFFWQLGKNIDPDKFVADPASIGNVTIDGKDYQGWDGSNKQAAAICAPKIGVTLQ